ncbi:cell division protein SepF [Candidatus Methanoliparum sp. LAM-1]|nr:cell division protein SepF [Candidatus Methanoliparum sp. LAM-1]
MPKWFSKSSEETASKLDEYKEIDLSEYEMETEVKTYVKFGKISEMNELPIVKREIFDGNIVILDISFLKSDEIVMKRFLREIKMVVEDINGDIAGIGENYIVITSKSIRIDRNKLFGGKI